MRYLHKTLKSVSGGMRIQVEFDKPVKILLLDSRQYKRYKSGISYTYYGGNAQDSPAMVKVPRKGDWSLVVETGSYFEERVVDIRVELLPPGEITHSLSTSDNIIGVAVDQILDTIDDEEISVTDDTTESEIKDDSENS